MAKLFALEEAEVSSDVIELETAPEVGEVADVQVDVEADSAEISEIEAGISEGVDAADQLEQVEEVVANAAEGDGLDPVAAEAVKIAVEAICARVGANPKTVYSLYATENFKSASSRKANTRYALEGLGEFLKNLWEKIKAALSSLWEKIKNFWTKHVSSLNRSLKALESMKERISKTKGISKYEPIDVPHSLRSIFPIKTATLGIDEINNFSATLRDAKNELNNFRLLEDINNAATLKQVQTVINSAVGNSGIEVKFGAENNPMPGGQYFKWTYKLQKEVDDGIEIITLDVEEDHGVYTDSHKDTQMDIASKEKLKTLITDTISSTKELIKYRDKVEQRVKAVTKSYKSIDTEIDNITKGNDPDKDTMAKTAKANIRSYNLILSKGPMMETKLLSANLAYIKGVLVYANTCLKNYKV